MFLREVEQSLKDTISNRTQENDSIAFQRLHIFLSQRPAEVHQLEARLEALYHSKTAIAPLDLFVEVLYIIKEHLGSNSVCQKWWHFVLSPALRRAHMPSKVIRHAIELIMIGLDDGEPEFRRMLVLSFVVGFPSINSVEGAIDSVSKTDEERSQEARWKESLIEIFAKDIESHPQQFFDELNMQFFDPSNRLSLVELLSRLALKEAFPITEFGNSSFAMSFLLSLFVDNSSSVFTLALSTLAMLVPHFAVKTPIRLKELLPEFLAILARAICWQNRGVEYEDPPDIWHRSLEIREDLQWKRLEMAFDSVASTSPDATRYFTFLYGVFPVNTITFLREPVAYLEKHKCQTPFKADWEEVLYYEDEIWNRCDNLLRSHVLHPALIRVTAQQELESPPFWNTDVTGLITACSILDVRNSVAASQGTLGELQAQFDVWTEGGEVLAEKDGNTTPLVEHSFWQGHGRPAISIRQLMETHSLLKSGLPVNIVNDYSDVLSTPRLHSTQIPAFETAAATLASTLERPMQTNGTRSPESVSLTSTQRDQAKDEAISVLQRDLLLMMNELNFETYLLRTYLATIGDLHKKSSRTRSSELDRQRMREQIRLYEAEIERHKCEKQKLQDEIDRYREGGDNFSQNMRHKLHNMKKEKEDWLAEATALRTRDSEMQEVLKAKSERLRETEIQILKLENEKKENETRIHLIQDYTRQIEVLRKAEQVWHADGRRLKWQDELIKQYKSKLTTMQSIIDSETINNNQLAEENRFLERRLDQLEFEIEQIRFVQDNPRPSDGGRVARQREQALREEIDTLKKENTKLRSQNSHLEDQLLQEQAKREELQIREQIRLRQGEDTDDDNEAQDEDEEL